jgi:hypothetical protein
MRRSLRARIGALAIACAALAAAGCGSDEGEPIPRAQVAELNKQLRSVQNRFEFGGGACADIERENLPAIERTLGQIPDSVDAEVRDALEESVSRLEELVASDCDEEQGQETTPAPTPTLPAPETPPETQTQETVPPEEPDEDQQDERPNTTDEPADGPSPGRGGGSGGAPDPDGADG